MFNDVYVKKYYVFDIACYLNIIIDLMLVFNMYK